MPDLISATEEEKRMVARQEDDMYLAPGSIRPQQSITVSPAPGNIQDKYNPNKPPTSLIIGPIGTGKTTCLATYIQAGLQLAVLFTDPGGEESLIDSLERLNLPLDNVHWAYITPTQLDWEAMAKMAGDVGAMSYEDLTKIKAVGKKRDTQFFKIVSLLANFKCDRTGKELGPVDKLDNTWALGVDSASGLNSIALDMMIGTKPCAHQGEYGIAMNMLETLIKKLTGDLNCFFTLTAHVEKNVSELTGLQTFQVALLGKQLAAKDKVAKLFSDVVLSKRIGREFLWSTEETNVDLKNRTLPISNSLQPSFVQIVEKYHERLKRIGAM